MSINLNDTTPSAPSGFTNVAWQKDTSGNVSANIPTPDPSTGAANEVLATPDGSSGAVTLRALLASDIPALAESKITNLTTDLAAKAPLASPTFTGTPAAPTPLTADNSTTLATTAFVKAQGYGTGGGSVTSVALTAPSDFTVTGSPVTGSGTLAIAANTQSANLVKAGPTTGSPAAPTYRALVAADLPLATTGAFGAVKPDGTTVTISAGVISAAGGGGSVAYIPTPTAPPLVSSLTWMNQSTATAIDASNGIYMVQPSTATQFIAALVQTAPATPWTFTAGLMGFNSTVNFIAMGICVSDGTKITELSFQFDSSGVYMTNNNWNSATSFSAGVAGPTARFGSLITTVLWMQVADDGTNRTFSFSYDGVNFIQMSQVGRTNFLTASKLGIQLKAQNASGAQANMTCVSWKVA